ncbi:MAG: hypothetical protein AB4426_35500 [Xenococcaceae cyanobacterium]
MTGTYDHIPCSVYLPWVVNGLVGFAANEAIALPKIGECEEETELAIRLSLEIALYRQSAGFPCHNGLKFLSVHGLVLKLKKFLSEEAWESSLKISETEANSGSP